MKRLLFNGSFYNGAAIAFSPDGSQIGVGTLKVTSEGEVLLWDLRSWKKRVLVKETDGSVGIGFVNQGRWLATGGASGKITVWDVASGRAVARFVQSEGTPVAALATSPDGKTVATGDDVGVIRFWAIPNPAARAANRW